MYDKDNHMKTFIGLSVTAAVLAGVLIVSCAPVPMDSSRNSSQQSQPLSQLQQNTGSVEMATEAAALDGEWNCASASGCAYSSISISCENSSAILNSSSSQQQNAKLSLAMNQATSIVQLNLNVIASGPVAGMSLEGTISLNSSGNQNQLMIGSDSYIRSTTQSATNN
jgi:hypothetical protein